ncbi:MAG: hypothetical protein ACYC0T_11025 [Ramlibacter sp.]
MLEAYKDLARGNLVHSSIRSASMPTARAGFVPAMRDIPVVEGHAVADGDSVRVALINKHPQSSVLLRLGVAGVDSANVSVREIGASDFFSREISVRHRSDRMRRGSLDVHLPRHSFTVVRIGT